MSFPHRLETDRMVLRLYDVHDLEAHVGILSNWDVTQWLSRNVPFPYTLFDGKKFIEEAIKDFMGGQSFRYAMIDKKTGQHMGGIRVFSLTAEAEIGYWLHPDYWGRGYGTELLKGVIGAGFKTGIITRFVAQTMSSNGGSRRILEKVGFIHEGEVPEDYDREGDCEGCSEFFRLKIENWENQ